jgi:hypothetical protein
LKVRAATIRGTSSSFLNDVVKDVRGVHRNRDVIVLSTAKETAGLPLPAETWPALAQEAQGSR